MPLSDPFVLKQNDTLSILVRTLYNADGTVIDLTGAAVKFLMRKRGNASPKVNAAAVINDAPGGIVQYVWVAADTDVTGEYDAEWQVTFAGGTIITVPNDSHMRVTVMPELGS